jgi:hypothetical protein
MMCVDTVGAAFLLGVSRMSVYLWRKAGILDAIFIGEKTFIPIRDIARKKGKTQKEIIAIAEREGISLWQVKQ